MFGGYLDTSYEDMKAVVTPAFQLPKGIYYIEASYMEHGIAKAGLIYNIPGKKELVDDYETELVPDKENVSYRFRIHDDSAMRFKLRLTGDAGEGDYVLLRQVHIVSSRLTYVYNLFCLAAFFLVLDLILLGYHAYYKKQEPEQKIIFLTLIATAFLMGIPLYQKGLPDSWDLEFHLYRIEGIRKGLQSGQFPVRIQPGWLENNGYASSIFYGDLFLYIPVILRMAGFTMQGAYKFYIGMVNTAAVFIAYYAFQKVSKNSRAAAIASILYSGATDRLCLIYKAFVGGYSAMVFFPLILAGFYLLFAENEESDDFKKSWILLTLGFSGLLMTHMISCLMVGAYSVLCCLIMIRKVLQKKRFLELLKAAVASVLLNLWFLVPFIQYMLFEKVRINSTLSQDTGDADYRAILTKYENTGKSLYDLFIDTDGIGCALLAVLLIYIVTIPIQKKNRHTQNSRVVLGFTLFSIWVYMDLFPVISLVKINSIFLKYFTTIQFQFRFISVAVTIAACLSALFFAMDIWDKRMLLAMAGLLCCMTFYQDLRYFETVESNVVYLDNPEAFSSIVMQGEYVPIVTDIGRLTQEIENEEAVQIHDVKREYLTFDVSVTNQTKQEQQILMPVLHYSGYKAYDSQSRTELETSVGDNGRVAVAIPADYNGTFHMAFCSPWYWRASEMISFATLVWILYDVLKRKEILKRWKLKKLQIPHFANTAE